MVAGAVLGTPPSVWTGARDEVLAGQDVLPVLPALRELLPVGGLQRGSVVSTGNWGLLGAALAAGASAGGAWCAVVGLPQIGVVAAADAGMDASRLLLIAEPGPSWPQVVAALLDGCELVLVRPPGRPSAQLRRKLEAIVRRFGGVLVVAGDWDGAQVKLTVARQEWIGIGTGHGRLRACRAQVLAAGRGAAARTRERWLWLPGADGTVTAVESDRMVTAWAPGGVHLRNRWPASERDTVSGRGCSGPYRDAAAVTA